MRKRMLKTRIAAIIQMAIEVVFELRRRSARQQQKATTEQIRIPAKMAM
jgi:hypothetical protein